MYKYKIQDTNIQIQDTGYKYTNTRYRLQAQIYKYKIQDTNIQYKIQDTRIQRMDSAEKNEIKEYKIFHIYMLYTSAKQMSQGIRYNIPLKKYVMRGFFFNYLGLIEI